MKVWTAVLIAGLALLGSGLAMAGDTPKPPTCQEQLSDVTMQAYNLDADRDAKERKFAAAQVVVYQLQQSVAQLQAQLATMKKSLEDAGKPKE